MVVFSLICCDESSRIIWCSFHVFTHAAFETGTSIIASARCIDGCLTKTRLKGILNTFFTKRLYHTKKHESQPGIWISFHNLLSIFPPAKAIRHHLRICGVLHNNSGLLCAFPWYACFIRSTLTFPEAEQSSEKINSFHLNESHENDVHRKESNGWKKWLLCLIHYWLSKDGREKYTGWKKWKQISTSMVSFIW